MEDPNVTFWIFNVSILCAVLAWVTLAFQYVDAVNLRLHSKSNMSPWIWTILSLTITIVATIMFSTSVSIAFDLLPKGGPFLTFVALIVQLVAAGCSLGLYTDHACENNKRIAEELALFRAALATKDTDRKKSD